jgi:ubiquinone biosynthesis protein
MERELDFGLELDNLQRLYDLAGGDPDERIPRAYPAYSTRRVLTLEYLHGIPFSELLNALRAGTDEELRRIDALGVDRRRLADALVRVSLRQIFRNRFFHADLHPGNLLVLPGDRIGFVDFGLCEELDETIRNSQVRYLTAAASGEPERIFRAMTEILLPGETTDMEAFRRDFLGEARNLKFTRDAPAEGRERLEQSPIARYLIGVMRSARRNDLQVPTRVLALYRTLLTLERVSGELGEADSLRRIGGDFLARLQKEDALDTFELENLQPILLSLLNLKRDAPAQLNELLKDLADGNFNLQVYNAEAARTERSRNRRSRLLAAAVLCVAVALLLARPELPRPFGVSLAWPLGAVLAGLYLLVFHLWRQLR